MLIRSFTPPGAAAQRLLHSSTGLGSGGTSHIRLGSVFEKPRVCPLERDPQQAEISLRQPPSARRGLLPCPLSEPAASLGHWELAGSRCGEARRAGVWSGQQWQESSGLARPCWESPAEGVLSGQAWAAREAAAVDPAGRDRARLSVRSPRLSSVLKTPESHRRAQHPSSGKTVSAMRGSLKQDPHLESPPTDGPFHSMRGGCTGF